MFRPFVALLAFGVEAAALWAYGAWGFHLPLSFPMRIAAVLGAVAGVGAFWGLLLAPKAKRRLQGPAQPVAKIVVFAGAAILTWTMGAPLLALALASLAAASLALEYLLGMPPVTQPGLDP